MANISLPPRTARRDGYGPVGRSPWLDIDWRTLQQWIIVDDNPVNVIQLGEGPPLVFIHGLSGSWQNWLEQLPVFAANHRVIALDLPGFGYSPPPREKITISGYGRLLDELFETLGVDAAAVVGNSMGGFTAAELAIAFPQRVERLVLVSPAGISTYAHPGATRALPTLRRAERLLAAQTGWVAANAERLARRPRLRDLTLNVVALHPSLLPAPLAAEQLRGTGKPGFIEALEANLNYDFRHRLPEIVCPTLIVWGAEDKLITSRDAAVYAELIPGSRKILLEDTGHTAMLERPAEFNELLEDFLSE